MAELVGLGKSDKCYFEVLNLSSKFEGWSVLQRLGLWKRVFKVLKIRINGSF